MAGDSIGDKLKQASPKTWALVAVALILGVVMTLVWWPEGPKVDPAAQKALEAMKNDKDANPPVADVPPPTDGPRRKATKGK
jgi:hypothetical protein